MRLGPLRSLLAPAAAGAVLAGVTLCPAPLAAEDASRDPRLAQLLTFFGRHRSPARTLASDFLRAADRENLDWRLLPSIAVAESGGGRNGSLHNLFGWRSGRARFTSARDSIYYVAGRLARAPFYKGKSLEQKLRAYNPVPGYVRRIQSLMMEISPGDHQVLAQLESKIPKE